jgi:hypothetical protein
MLSTTISLVGHTITQPTTTRMMLSLVVSGGGEGCATEVGCGRNRCVCVCVCFAAPRLPPISLSSRPDQLLNERTGVIIGGEGGRAVMGLDWFTTGRSPDLGEILLPSSHRSPISTM